MERPFKIGDYVRARKTKTVPAGTVGRVTLILLSVEDMYCVQFDERDHPTLMRGVDLALVTDALTEESEV